MRYRHERVAGHLVKRVRIRDFRLLCCPPDRTTVSEWPNIFALTSIPTIIISNHLQRERWTVAAKSIWLRIKVGIR
jgi:hypothetical protein